MQQLSLLEVLNIGDTNITHLPVWLASLRSLKELRCSDRPFVGVSMADNTLVAFVELAAVVSNSSDPEEVEKLTVSFEEMIIEEPLSILRISNVSLFFILFLFSFSVFFKQMHLAPRTPLRALCVSKCAAQHSSLGVDLGR
eukprot:TRINITY_DN4926_c1_g1_i1.p1 TRINITY_DN4926_c1_g1~~TRINITY_DN4926_c1_g1_i1.p1  ORF type:complete len:151 (+),score=38.57 TRINITY_DN4926_c1_g1_i1:32-454(+)